MNKGTAIDLGLNEAYNDLFSTQEDRDNAQRSYVTDLPPEKISDFPNHPFKVRMDQSMIELSDSVKQYGVLVPSLVRPMLDGSYQMVSGHRRKRAAELAGLPTVRSWSWKTASSLLVMLRREAVAKTARFSMWRASRMDRKRSRASAARSRPSRLMEPSS